MPHPDFSPGRRRLLTSAVALSATAMAGGLSGCATSSSRRTPSTEGSPDTSWRYLDSDTRAFWRAMLPALGRGQNPDTLHAVEDPWLRGIDGTVHFFSLHNQDQLQQLFGLLALAPSRWLLAGHWKGWSEVSAGEAEDTLHRWRHSSLAKLNLAYASVTRLGGAALYGQPEVQATTGYPGPPERALRSLPQFRENHS